MNEKKMEYEVNIEIEREREREEIDGMEWKENGKKRMEMGRERETERDGME